MRFNTDQTSWVLDLRKQPRMSSPSYVYDWSCMRRLVNRQEQSVDQPPHTMDEFTISLLKHELRTPVASVIAFASLLLRNPSRNLSDGQTNQLKAIQRGGVHLNDLIERVFDIAQLLSGDMALTVTPTEIGSLMIGLTETMSPVLAGKNQSIEIDTGSHSHWALADGIRICEAAMDVISNASKYSPFGSTIKLSIRETRGKIEIAISDEGPGIPAEERLIGKMEEIGKVGAISTAGAILKALDALGAAKISMATPYTDETNQHEKEFLAKHRVDVLAMAGLGLNTSLEGIKKMSRVPPAEIYAHAKSVNRPDAQAILICCTDFGSLDVVDAL